MNRYFEYLRFLYASSSHLWGSKNAGAILNNFSSVSLAQSRLPRVNSSHVSFNHQLESRLPGLAISHLIATCFSGRFE